MSTRLLVAALALAAVAGGACHDTPTYVVTFEAQDAAPGRDAGHSAAAAPPTAAPADAAEAPAVPTVARAVSECNADADCVLVRAECCGCARGGRQTAVARARAAEHAANMEKSCGAAPACPKAKAADPTCGMTAGCVDHRCMLVDKAAAAAKPAAPECATAADCVAVDDGCCGCSAGGKARAIARKEAKAFRAAQAKRCGETMCPQVMSNDPTCARTPDCVGGRCVLVDAAKKAK